MSSVQLQSVSKSFGDHWAVRDFTLEIAEGEFLVLLGPSGCGKTTTLRMIAGFIEPSAGRILFGNRDVTDLAPYHRNTGLVFQGYALFPHLTVFENVAFGLRMRKLDRAVIERRTREALRVVRRASPAATSSAWRCHARPQPSRSSCSSPSRSPTSTPSSARRSG